MPLVFWYTYSASSFLCWKYQKKMTLYSHFTAFLWWKKKICYSWGSNLLGKTAASCWSWKLLLQLSCSIMQLYENNWLTFNLQTQQMIRQNRWWFWQHDRLWSSIQQISFWSSFNIFSMSGPFNFHEGTKKLPWNKAENASTLQTNYSPFSCLSLVVTDSHLDMTEHLHSPSCSPECLCFPEN